MAVNKWIRFVGGPADDEVHVFQPPDLLTPIKRPGWKQEDVVEAELGTRAGKYEPMGIADEDGNEMFRWSGWEEHASSSRELPMSKPMFTTHEEAKAEAMKSWSYRFWYYLLWPKYRLIRLWLQLRHVVGGSDVWR